MNLISLFSSFTQKTPQAVICPHCEKRMFEHDETECKRKMSRRFFVGMLAGCTVLATLPKANGETELVLATPEHVRQMEDEMTGAKFMVSRHGEYIVSSVLCEGNRWNSKQNFPVNVLKLRAQGWDVRYTKDKAVHEQQIREATARAFARERSGDFLVTSLRPRGYYGFVPQN